MISFSSNGKQVLKDGEHMADAVSEGAAREIVEALNGSPLIRFGEAEAIGREVHDRWEKLAPGNVPLSRDDMAWGDIVQFIIRMAQKTALEREWA